MAVFSIGEEPETIAWHMSNNARPVSDHHPTNEITCAGSVTLPRCMRVKLDETGFYDVKVKARRANALRLQP